MSGVNLTGTTHTNAGSYVDAWTFTDPTGNYNDATGTVSDDVSKAVPTLSVGGPGGTYDPGEAGQVPGQGL
jgi:hypothetical protein